ncbi:MAG: hypothetical protein HFI86_02290 [Bacilli bacterium]|nr:hypothetical protein [Bacilli bacterium]
MNKLLDDEEYLNYKFNAIKRSLDNLKTNEILECLKLLEELDTIYDIMKQNNICGMNIKQYQNYKIAVIKNTINMKLFNINCNKERIEFLKSLLDELKYCKNRYKEYSKLFNVEILKIENMLL